MLRVLFALMAMGLVAACSAGPSAPTPAPTQDISSLDPCAVVDPAEVEALVGPFLQPPQALTADASGARTCNYTGEQANVSIVFSTAIASPELFRSQKQAAIAAGAVPEPGVGDDAFYALRPAAFNGGLLTALVGTQQYTVGVQVIPNTNTKPLKDPEFETVAVAIGKLVAEELAAS